MAKHNTIGQLGEDLAVKWLTDSNFTILGRNYRKKWGEIDIIARSPIEVSETSSSVHFVEVKTVSYETLSVLDLSVSRETWRPEDNVHFQKLKRLGRAIETWIAENSYAGAFQVDVVTVKLVPREKYARIKLIENVTLG